MATTTAWEPKASAQALIRSRFSTAAVLTEILSAPACSTARAVSTSRMPPATQNGMSRRAETRSTQPRSTERPSGLAVMS